MGARENGLTLEGLAQRLEALERENERMRSENTELRHEVSALRASGTPRNEVAKIRGPGETQLDGEPVSVLEGRLSRRSLLTKGGAAALGAVAAGTLMQRDIREAKASHATVDSDQWSVNYLASHRVVIHGFDAVPYPALEASRNHFHACGVFTNPDGAGSGIVGENLATTGGGAGVKGESKSASGVHGTGKNGVYGESNQAGFYGVTGRNNNTNGTGVRGVGAGAGVLGESTGGIGVKGVGKHGVWGESSTAGVGAVEARNTGGGHGVGAVGRVGVLAFSHTDGESGVWGQHTTNGYGVAGDSARGTGVKGVSPSGYGGQFEGGKAQLRLVPGSRFGKPPLLTHHTQGEIYMDKGGSLFVCVASSTDAEAAKWKKVRTIDV